MAKDGSDYIDRPPKFVTDTEHLDVLNELIGREPLFHHPEFGRTRQDFESMTDAAFWEAGASGRRYSRESVIAEVTKRHEDSQYRGVHAPPESSWQTKDFWCREIAPDSYFVDLHSYSKKTSDSPGNYLATLWR